MICFPQISYYPLAKYKGFYQETWYQKYIRGVQFHVAHLLKFYCRYILLYTLRVFLLQIEGN